MATTIEVDRTRAKTGYIQYEGTTYVAAGNVNVNVGKEISGSTYEYRGFLSFPTSGLIPEGNTVTKVEFFCNIAGGADDPDGAVTDWITDIYVGTFIGASFNGAEDEWNGGTLAVSHNWDIPMADIYIDLGQVGIDNFNNAGETDLKLVDANTNTGLTSYWLIDIDNRIIAAGRCKLRITYDVTPSPTISRNKTKAGLGKVIW